MVLLYYSTIQYITKSHQVQSVYNYSLITGNCLIVIYLSPYHTSSEGISMSIKVSVSLETDWNIVSKRNCPLCTLRTPKLVPLVTTSLFVLGITKQNVEVAVCGSIKRYRKLSVSYCQVLTQCSHSMSMEDIIAMKEARHSWYH